MDQANNTSENIENENLDKLRKIFPEFIKDGIIDFDALKAFFEKEGKLPENQEKYGLSWAGKSNAFKLIRTPATGTLTPDEKESKDFDKTENLFIEGDNLEVLKLLQKHYREQIKMIYIDPPYNTGKDFIYKDNFTEDKSDYYERTGQNAGGIPMTTNRDSSGRYHSDWLTMMYPRLFLARNLLKEDGVIFISIDDNEVANLRLIMDEIFGEENFQGCISRVTGTPTGGGNKAIVNEIDYILIYSKSEIIEIEGLPFNSEDESIYNKEDREGRYLTRPLRRTGGEDKREDRPSMFFPIKSPDGTNVLPIGPTGYESRWICGEKRFKEMQGAGLIEWDNKGGKWQVYQKFYLEGRLKQPSNLWKDGEGNKKATRDLRDIFNSEKLFDFPKPVGLVKKMVSLVTDEDSIILDFFAGSGTTAHAVMDLNAEDGGNRKWICVQLPEMTDENSEARKAGFENIAQISRERIRRAGKKIAVENDKKLPLGKENDSEDLDLGFKAYTLSPSNYREWNIPENNGDTAKLKEQMQLIKDKPLADNFDIKSVIYEIMLKEGFSPNSRVVMHQIGGLDVWVVENDEPWSETENGKMFITLAEKLILAQIDTVMTGCDEREPIERVVLWPGLSSVFLTSA